MIYFSEFSPLPTLPGVKGTTSALLSTSSYNALVAAFSAIGDDNKLTAVEKQQVIREHTSNTSVNSSLVVQATSLGIKLTANG